MKIELLAAGTRPPDWVRNGFTEYRRRLPRHWQLELHEVQVARRRKGTAVKKLKVEEGNRMLGLLKANSRIVALDQTGSNWTTPEFAAKLQNWQQEFSLVQLFIGGPDGLSDECLQVAHNTWSLSRLTFPHFFVRVLVAEQIYRAWSILNNHPYHK